MQKTTTLKQFRRLTLLLTMASRSCLQCHIHFERAALIHAQKVCKHEPVIILVEGRCSQARPGVQDQKTFLLSLISPQSPFVDSFSLPQTMCECALTQAHNNRPQTKNHLPAFVRRSPRLNKVRNLFAVPGAVVGVVVDGKENVAPAPEMLDYGLTDLFEEGPADVELPLPPMTPTPKRRSERILLKTPSKTPQRQFGSQLSPNAEQPPIFRTPKNKQDHHPALTALLGTVPKNVLEMTPFSRSIHEAMTSDLPMEFNLIEHDTVMLRGSGGRKETPRKSNSFDFPRSAITQELFPNDG